MAQVPTMPRPHDRTSADRAAPTVDRRQHHGVTTILSYIPFTSWWCDRQDRINERKDWTRHLRRYLADFEGNERAACDGAD